MKPLNDMHELPVYGTDAARESAKRCAARGRKSNCRCIRWRKSTTRISGSFLEQAVAGFKKFTERVQQDPESIMPWKVLGRKWHLLRKGFPPGKRIALGSRSAGRTARNVVGRGAESANAVESQPGNQLDFARAARAVGARFGRSGRRKSSYRWPGRKGSLRWEAWRLLASIRNFDASRADVDVIKLRFIAEDHLHQNNFAEFLREHAAAICKTRGDVPVEDWFRFEN